MIGSAPVVVPINRNRTVSERPDDRSPSDAVDRTSRAEDHPGDLHPGQSPYPYIPALGIKPFLSANSADVNGTTEAGYPRRLCRTRRRNTRTAAHRGATNPRVGAAIPTGAAHRMAGDMGSAATHCRGATTTSRDPGGRCSPRIRGDVSTAPSIVGPRRGRRHWTADTYAAATALHADPAEPSRLQQALMGSFTSYSRNTD